MFFVAVTAEALGGGAYCPAVLALRVSPVYIQAILSCIFNIRFEFFKFLFIHHLPTISISNNTKIDMKFRRNLLNIVKIGLDMFGSIILDYQSFHLYFN